MLLTFLYYSSVLQFSESARERQRERLDVALRELARARERLQRGNDLIRRYVPSQLADHLLSGDYTDRERPERRKVTVLFSDVQGFTELADRLEPEDLASLLTAAEGHPLPGPRLRDGGRGRRDVFRAVAVHGVPRRQVKGRGSACSLGAACQRTEHQLSLRRDEGLAD